MVVGRRSFSAESLAKLLPPPPQQESREVIDIVPLPLS